MTRNCALDTTAQAVAHVIRKMAAKDPDQRYATHAELVAGLERCAKARKPKASYVKTVTYLTGIPQTEEVTRPHCG